jgi:starch phosphorylase
VELMKRVLPRHMQLIFEINRRFLDEVAARFPGDGERVARMSIIEESNPKQVRMAYLSIVGSHSVNGVARLHSDLVKSSLVPDFHAMWPERFNNKTNGVTPRRWIELANPPLSGLLDAAIGPGWVRDADELIGLEALADDGGFQRAFADVKRQNKERLAAVIRETIREEVDPTSLFDVQIKRIHEYKRQLLNVLHIIHAYLRIAEDGADLGPARTFVFAGKAAPGYYIAKRIIRLIHDVAAVVNRDPRSRGRMRVVFLPDYRVSLAEKIVPAADLSEQISTAGKEASGTGNMKLMMNGALTIGTLDGANVEIHEAVGADNIFIFGLQAHQVEQMRRDGAYDPWAYYRAHDDIRRVMDSLLDTRFSAGEPGRHRPLVDRILRDGDEYFHLADFHAYADAQARVASAYTDPAGWSRRVILNVARSGRFSSDRTIREYASEIWNLRPVR